MLKDDALTSNTVEAGGQPAARTEKTHTVRSRRIQRDENDVWFARCERESREATEDQAGEKNQSSTPQHGKQSNRLRKNSIASVFWEGHEFTRANKSFNFFIPRRLQPPRNLLSLLFPQPSNAWQPRSERRYG
jgi:hypothetical protein